MPGAVRYRSLMNYGKTIVVVTHVNEMAQKCLVTKEILTEFGLIEAKPVTTILEKECRACKNKKKKRELRRRSLKQKSKICIGNALKDSRVTLTGEKTPEHFKDMHWKT